MKRNRFAFLLLLAMLAGCGAPAIPVETSGQTAVAARVTAPPAATATAGDTATPVPTATPTVTPTPAALGPENFRELSQLRDYEQDVWALGGSNDWLSTSPAISPDSRSFVTIVGLDKVSEFAVMDVETGDPLASLKFGPEIKRISDPLFSPDGKKLVYSTLPDGNLNVWDVASEQLERVLWTKKDYAMVGLAFSPDGKLLAGMQYPYFQNTLISTAATVIVWDFDTGSVLAELPADRQPAYLHWSGDGRRLILTSAKLAKQWTIYDTATWKVVSRISPTLGSYLAVLSQDGALAITAVRDHDNDLQVWDTATGRQVKALHNELAEVQAMALSPDGRLLLLSGIMPFKPHTDNSYIGGTAWDTSTWTQLGYLYGSSLYEIIFAPDGRSVMGRQGKLSPIVRLGLPDDDLLEKRRTLLEFTDALAKGDYSRAGSLLVLSSYDQDALKQAGLPTEPAGVAEALCAQGGLPCLPATILYSAREMRERKPSWYHFLVQFNKPDGSIYTDAKGNSIIELYVGADSDGVFKVYSLEGWEPLLKK